MDTLSEYLVAPYYDNLYTTGVAFNPNDGVDTEQVANIPASSFTYDYMILGDGNTLVSRWFIIEAQRLRNGQYKLTLRRDVFADSLEEVLDAPAFIEKGTLKESDPMIFNREDITVNQIKKEETLLKDATGTSWIVGYMSKGTTQPSIKNIEYELASPFDTLSNFETLYDSLKSTALTSANGKVIYTPNKDYYIDVFYGTNNQYYDRILREGVERRNALLPGTYSLKNYEWFQVWNRFQDIAAAADNYFNAITTTQYNDLIKYSGKMLYDNNTNKYYRVVLTNTAGSAIPYIGVNPSGALLDELVYAVNLSDNLQGTAQANCFSVGVASCSVISYKLFEVSGIDAKYQIQSHTELNDAPYGMFAIPYGPFKFIDTDSTIIELDDELQSQNIAKAVFNDIIEQFGGNSGNLYDIQLLPYFPMQGNINADGSITLPNNSEYYTNILDSNDNVISRIVWCNESRFTLDIPYSYQVDNVKVSNQCDFMRLCSPNWNGQFEFSPAKNGGIDSFNVDCEYKPFQPYIHLNPNFAKLYGQDFNDARGLVCNGDFSVSQISDAWATYQRQNVNYEKIFNRQIVNMEVNNTIDQMMAKMSMGVGTAQGMLNGFTAGGPIGLVAGGTASAAAGAMDYSAMKAKQDEAIDYTRDQFGYSLGNIKALPDSLTKVSAFNNNNKIFPVLELYSCTDEERKAVEDKIKYNGMTVMRIGNIREFLKETPTYIKGKLIRVEGIEEDFHYVNELANEFNKGVFI